MSLDSDEASTATCVCQQPRKSCAPTDFVFFVGSAKHRFPVHRVMLYHNSPYFQILFDDVDARLDDLNVTDVECDTLHHALGYLYNDETTIAADWTAVEATSAVLLHKWQMPHLEAIVMAKYENLALAASSQTLKQDSALYLLQGYAEEMEQCMLPYAQATEQLAESNVFPELAGDARLANARMRHVHNWCDYMMNQTVIHDVQSVLKVTDAWLAMQWELRPQLDAEKRLCHTIFEAISAQRQARRNYPWSAKALCWFACHKWDQDMRSLAAVEQMLQELKQCFKHAEITPSDTLHDVIHLGAERLRHYYHTLLDIHDTANNHPLHRQGISYMYEHGYTGRSSTRAFAELIQQTAANFPAPFPTCQACGGFGQTNATSTHPLVSLHGDGCQCNPGFLGPDWTFTNAPGNSTLTQVPEEGGPDPIYNLPPAVTQAQAIRDILVNAHNHASYYSSSKDDSSDDEDDESAADKENHNNDNTNHI